MSTTVSLPDTIGEYIVAPERFETDGLQYVGYFEPATIAPRQVANLYLFMQNTLNTPIKVTMQPVMPQVGGGLFRSGKPVLKVAKPAMQFQLTPAEAGLLTLPVTTTEEAEAGNFEVVLETKVQTTEGAQRVRPSQGKSKLGSKSLIDNTIGLNLTSTMGATFTEKSVKNGTFPIEISGEPQEQERAPKLDHEYQTIWTQDRMEVFTSAIQEINSRQVKLQSELTTEAIYATMYGESVSRFADVGLALRVGEAIMLAKILTYGCQYFLSKPERQNGLLIPIWELALAEGYDTTDALSALRSAGYYHILKLSLAISFGLITRAVGRHLWSLEDRQAVTDYISENIATGEPLDPEFLYLPLLLAGTFISNKVVLEGEDPRHSLALMRKAYEARTDLFLDDEMAVASQAYHQIWKKTMA
jgi:hypothetical protein